MGTNVKFYTNVAKGLKLNKSQKVWWLNPTFVEVTGEKFVGVLFCLLPCWIGLIGNVLEPLPKSSLITLGLTATVSARDAAIHRKMIGSGFTTWMSEYFPEHKFLGKGKVKLE